MHGDCIAVSVVIPTYNRRRLLERTVQSVLNQSCSSLELIIVDDGSNDDTADYLGHLSDPRVRQIPRPHTGNIASLRNHGAHAARGQWLCFLDSDDLWLRDKLEVQLARTTDSGHRWSYTRYEHIDENGEVVPPRSGSWRELTGSIAESILDASASVALCTVMMDRALFLQIGGFNEDVRLVYREDYHFIVRIALAADGLAIPDTLGQVRTHAERSTGSLDDVQAFRRTAYAYRLLTSQLPTLRMRNVARHRRVRSQLVVARKLLKRSIAGLARNV